MSNHTQGRENIISQVSFFASLPRGEIRYLAQVLRPYALSAGEVLMKEGDQGDQFYILLDGEVEVYKALGKPDERLLAVRQAGAFIGEMSLMNRDGLRTASVRARNRCNVLEMTREDFNALLIRQPTLAYDMARVLVSRLQQAENATIRDLRAKNIQLTQAYQELEAAQAQLIEKERLERELEVAHDIQQGILPRGVPSYSGIVFDACISPTRAVGGDFYDFIPLGEDTIGIAVGDVSDHGVASAMFMALTVTLLRAEARRASPLPTVLRNVNRHLLEVNDANMFVTVLYGELNCRTRQFSYVRAGHELPILLDRQGEYLDLSYEQGMPLGLFDDPALDEQSIDLAHIDTLLLYTDGVTDAVDPQGELFGKQRLRRALREFCHAPGDGICQNLLSTVQAFSANVHQYDDITLLSMQVVGRV